MTPLKTSDRLAPHKSFVVDLQAPQIDFRSVVATFDEKFRRCVLRRTAVGAQRIFVAEMVAQSEIDDFDLRLGTVEHHVLHFQIAANRIAGADSICIVTRLRVPSGIRYVTIRHVLQV